MRQGDEARVMAQEVAWEVADVGVQAAVVQAIEHGFLVDDAITREVEQDAALLHQLDAVAVDQVLRRRQQRHVQADEVAALDEIVDADGFLDLRRQAPGGVDGDFRVEADDVHAELNGRLGEHRADGAEADDAERAAAQLMADVVLLAGFDLLVQRFVVAEEAVDEGQRRRDVARAHQHAGDHQLLDGVGVGAGGVEDDHAAFAHGLGRDVVGAGAGAADSQHTGGDRHVVHYLRADQDGVRVGDVVADDVAVRQAGQALLRDRVERLDLAGHSGFLELSGLMGISRAASRMPSSSRPAPGHPRPASRCRSTRACRPPSGDP